MKKKYSVVIISIVVALILLSSGYGLWERTLTIRGNLIVKKPDFTEQVIPKLSVVDEVYLEDLGDIAIEGDGLDLVTEPGSNPSNEEFTEVSEGEFLPGGNVPDEPETVLDTSTEPTSDPLSQSEDGNEQPDDPLVNPSPNHTAEEPGSNPEPAEKTDNGNATNTEKPISDTNKETDTIIDEHEDIADDDNQKTSTEDRTNEMETSIVKDVGGSDELNPDTEDDRDPIGDYQSDNPRDGVPERPEEHTGQEDPSSNEKGDQKEDEDNNQQTVTDHVYSNQNEEDDNNQQTVTDNVYHQTVLDND